MNFSATDERNVKLIGILMLAAKLLDEATADATAPEITEEACVRAAKGYESLIKTMMRFFPKRGDLETQVIAFAKRQGYVIEQQYITPNKNPEVRQ